MKKFNNIVFFTGAGMSAESGIHTYRGKGGTWEDYNWEEVACQSAFDNNPQKVLEFHELRRKEVLKAKPHNGHRIIHDIQKRVEKTNIITQNIDGMHQRADTSKVIELHGSLWRLRCESDGILINDKDNARYNTKRCQCGAWLRPDIVWFQDILSNEEMKKASQIISNCDLFVSVGTSGVVWPAAGYIELAKESGAFCVDINPEDTNFSDLYDKRIKMNASVGLINLLELLSFS